MRQLALKTTARHVTWSVPLAVSLAAFLVVAARAAGSVLGLDYDNDAGPPILALAHGHVGEFFRVQALMGSASLILRAPFVALVPDTNRDAQYAIGVLPCLAVVLFVALHVRREVVARWGASVDTTALFVLALLSAPVLEALVFGHPEEPLGAALCVGATVCAIQRRPTAAGLLLGLALATKQWAAFAVLPVLLASAGARPRTLVIAGATALALTLPLALGDHEAFARIQHTAGSSAPVSTPMSVWALVSDVAPTSYGGFAQGLTPPAFASALARPVMGLAILLLVVAFARSRVRRTDALALLALVFLARCALDLADNVYYHAPFLAALTAWEVLRAPRPPWLSAASASVLGVIALASRLDGIESRAITAVYLAWALAVTVAVCRMALGAQRAQPVRVPGALDARASA